MRNSHFSLILFLFLFLFIAGWPMQTYSESDPWDEFKKEVGGTDDIVERYADVDIAYPASKEEYCGLSGNAIAMMRAISEHKDELPIERACIRTADNREVEIKKLVMSSTNSSFTGDEITKTKFSDGKKDIFVNLSFWSIPVSLLVDDNFVFVIDFRVDRKGFTLNIDKGDVDTNSLEYLMKQSCGAIKVDERIDAKVLENFLMREFIHPYSGKQNVIVVHP